MAHRIEVQQITEDEDDMHGRACGHGDTESLQIANLYWTESDSVRSLALRALPYVSSVRNGIEI